MPNRFPRKQAQLTKFAVNSRARSWPWLVPSFEPLECRFSGVYADALRTLQHFVRPSGPARRKKHTARLLGSEQLESRVVPAAVWTGLPDYHPCSTALITGTGFAVGETVQLQVLHTDGAPSPGDAPWSVVDGAASDPDGTVDGYFQTSWYVGLDCAGATLELTARGLSSGDVADWVFTDSAPAPTTASVTTPANGSAFRAATVPASFSGSVADNSSGVGLAANSTTFTLQRSSNNFYWTGSAWQAAVFNLAATNSATTGGTAATWTSSAMMPTWASQSDGTYTVQAKATDKAGSSFTGTAVSFTLDSTAPTTASVTTPANGSSFRVAAVPASFSGSVADNTGGAGLAANSATFTLERGSDGFYWTGSAWQTAAFSLAASNAATTGGAGVTWTSNATLPTWSSQAGGTYTVQATATDRAGNTFTGTAVSFNLDTTPATLGPFELNGTATSQTGPDWAEVYNDAVLNPGQDTSGSIPGAVAFIHLPDTEFKGGQSKVTNDVNQWGWTTGTPQDKATLLDVFAAAYSVPSGGENHTIIDFGADRYANNGDTTIGFWFFQNPVSMNPDGTFSGAHTVGDIFIVADFGSGAPQRSTSTNGSGRAAPTVPSRP